MGAPTRSATFEREYFTNPHIPQTLFPTYNLEVVLSDYEKSSFQFPLHPHGNFGDVSFQDGGLPGTQSGVFLREEGTSRVKGPKQVNFGPTRQIKSRDPIYMHNIAE